MKNVIAPTPQEIFEQECTDFGTSIYSLRHHGVPMAYLYAEFFVPDRELVKTLKAASNRFAALHSRLFRKSREGLFGEAALEGDFGEWLHANLERLRTLDEDAAEMYRVDQLKYLVD